MYIKTVRGWMPLIRHCSNSNQLEGVFSSVPLEDNIRHNAKRLAKYGIAVEQYGKGMLDKERIFDAFNEPMYGAFGEKL